jgi:hypothetical protein
MVKILHQAGDYDVRRDRPNVFTVCHHKGTHAVTVQSFADVTLAIAFANYKAGKRGRATLDGARAQA